tara:strand:- start:388 stop:525 length:138 start_codon:yes stop_codon:yes gene_type:complete
MVNTRTASQFFFNSIGFFLVGGSSAKPQASSTKRQAASREAASFA